MGGYTHVEHTQEGLGNQMVVVNDQNWVAVDMAEGAQKDIVIVRHRVEDLVDPGGID